MRWAFAIILLLSISTEGYGCDFSQPDKIKHFEYSKKVTVALKKVLAVPFLPLKPVKWVFNDKIQLLFPDNYIPHIISGTIVFTAGILKEVPIDLLGFGTPDICDLAADCKGIKCGIQEK